MARPSSKIMSAGELRLAKADVKREIATHVDTVKAADKSIKLASSELVAATKQADRLLTDARKVHVAAIKQADRAQADAVKSHVVALKVATKAFEVAQKAHGKAGNTAAKSGTQAEAKLASLETAVAAAPVLTLHNSGAAEDPMAPVVKRGRGRPAKLAMAA